MAFVATTEGIKAEDIRDLMMTAVLRPPRGEHLVTRRGVRVSGARRGSQDVTKTR
jgi:hypothetical protein